MPDCCLGSTVGNSRRLLAEVRVQRFSARPRYSVLSTKEPSPWCSVLLLACLGWCVVLLCSCAKSTKHGAVLCYFYLFYAFASNDGLYLWGAPLLVMRRSCSASFSLCFLKFFSNGWRFTSMEHSPSSCATSVTGRMSLTLFCLQRQQTHCTTGFKTQVVLHCSSTMFYVHVSFSSCRGQVNVTLE